MSCKTRSLRRVSSLDLNLHRGSRRILPSPAPFMMTSREVQKLYKDLLEHYNAEFTLQTYARTTRQKQDEAAQAMGNLMAQVQ